MIINGRAFSRNYEKNLDYIQGVKERLQSDKDFISFLAKQMYNNFLQLETDRETGDISEDIYLRYLPEIAEFFRLIDAPRNYGDFKDVAAAYKKATDKYAWLQK